MFINLFPWAEYRGQVLQGKYADLMPPGSCVQGLQQKRLYRAEKIVYSIIQCAYQNIYVWKNWLWLWRGGGWVLADPISLISVSWISFWPYKMLTARQKNCGIWVGVHSAKISIQCTNQCSEHKLHNVKCTVYTAVSHPCRCPRSRLPGKALSAR